MKIFVSYSQEIGDWIEELINGLKNKIENNNLDIEIIWDKTHLKLGYNMHFFMENSIREADKVFIFCDTSYTEKANGRNRGVGIETTIITPKMYGKVDQTKFIPVILWNCDVPDYLDGVYGIPIESREVTESVINKFYSIIQKMINDKLGEEGFFGKIDKFKKKYSEIALNVNKEKIKSLLEDLMRENTATDEDICALFPELNNKKSVEENQTKININPIKKKGSFYLTEDSILNEIFDSTREDWNKEEFRDFFTYKHNILLTIEEKEESERKFFQPWANRHPDKKAYFHEYEIKYDKTRVTSIYLVSVDGGRAYIPLPNIETNKVKDKHMKFANIIHSYPENINYEYVERSGLEIDYND